MTTNDELIEIFSYFISQSKEKSVFTKDLDESLAMIPPRLQLLDRMAEQLKVVKEEHTFFDCFDELSDAIESLLTEYRQLTGKE